MTAVAAPDPAQLEHRRILLIFSGLMLGMLLASLDHTIVATALPRIAGELNGLDHISWVVTSYLLATTASTPIYGKLGDLYGRKRVFQVAIVIFLVGSVLCGLAQTLEQLVLFRAVQGLGGGGLIVLAQAIIADVVGPRERGRYQGYFGAVFATSSVAGPLLGGFFTDQLDWRWVFYINLPLGIVALLVTARFLPPSIRRARARIDYLGSTLLIAAVSAVVLATTWGGNEYAWGSPAILALLAGAVVLLAGFVAVERRATEPVLPLGLFRNRTFLVSTGVSVAIGLALYGVISFLPVFLQVVHGVTATQSGLLLVPLMGGLLTSSIVAGQLISRRGRYRIFPVVGTGVAAVGMALMATMDADTSLVLTGTYMVVVGVGLGLCMQVLVIATQNAVSPTQLGVATSSVNFFRSVGGSIGVALIGSIFAGRLSVGLAERLPGVQIDTGALDAEAVAALPAGTRETFLDIFSGAITTGFRIGVPVAVVAFLIVLALKELPLRGGPTSAASTLEGAEAFEDPEIEDGAAVRPPVPRRDGAPAPTLAGAGGGGRAVRPAPDGRGDRPGPH